MALRSFERQVEGPYSAQRKYSYAPLGSRYFLQLSRTFGQYLPSTNAMPSPHPLGSGFAARAGARLTATIASVEAGDATNVSSSLTARRAGAGSALRQALAAPANRPSAVPMSPRHRMRSWTF